MYFFPNLKKYFFLIILLYQNNINIISASTTDFEMDRVCADANFDKYKHKTGYRTVQHFADDEGMFLSSPHPFYRSLFMTREKSDMNLFIKSIGFELFIVALGGASFINYLIFIILWCVHKGFFRILSEKEKAERQKSKCRYCKFFVMFICLLISAALSCFGILFISNFKTNVNLSDCSYLRFTNHGLYGLTKNFAGTFNLRESFANLTYSLNNIDNFYSRMNLFDNNINTIKDEFDSRMEECNSFAVDNKVITPNPDGSNFDYIKTNYQDLYGPKTNKSTLIGIIYQHYTEKIEPIIQTLEEIKSDYQYLIQNKNDYISELTIYEKYFDTMTQMYQKLNDKIGRVLVDYTDMGVETIYYMTIILYVIYPLIIIILIIFIYIYVCKAQVGLCIVKYLRILIHVLWNILFVFTALGFIISGYIGSYRRYSSDLTISFNYLIGSGLINNPNSDENIFIEFAQDTSVSRSIGLFSACYNSSQSTNIANILDIKNTLLFYFNKLYQDYNTLLKLIYHNNLDESIPPLIQNHKNLLDTFLFNISKTTSSPTHLENDVSRYFKIVNKYTDYGNEETYQIDCATKMYDIWTSNRYDCPSGYIYSLDGSREKNCLVISDKEWTEDSIELRYLAICKMINEQSTGDQIKKYLKRIKKFYESNSNLITSMKSGADLLIDLYEQLVYSFNYELRIDNETLKNFTLPFSMFTNDENIFSIFDCGILKQDLIDFYDTVRNKLSSISIAHLVLLLLLNIFNLVAIYFLMTVLYTFYRTGPEEKQRKSTKEKTNDKLITINTKNKNKRKSSVAQQSNKRKTKSKLYVSMGKGTNSDTPSSSTDNMRTSNNESSQNEDEESEERTTSKKRTSSSQTSSSGTGSGSNSRSGTGSASGSRSGTGSYTGSGSRSGSGSQSQSKSKSKSKSSSKSYKKSKRKRRSTVKEEEEEEDEIEDGVRDDGSAMS